MDSPLRLLLCALVDLAVDDLPDDVLQKAVLVLADDLGAMAEGGHEPEVERLARAGATRAVAPPARAARVFCAADLRLAPTDAAVLNAIAGCWCEMDEGYRPLPCHAGLYALPAILAEAEVAGVTTGDVLRALVGAYEFAARVARAFRFEALLIHPHAFFPATVAAMGAGLVRRVPIDQLEAAVTLAASMSGVGPFNHAPQGVLARNVWAAAGTWAGMQAVDWAAAGISGSHDIFSDLAKALRGASFDPGHLGEDVGVRWSILDGYHKSYPCCQYTHSAIEAAERLLAMSPDIEGGERIAAIEAHTHPLGMTLAESHPTTSLGARFSLPHAIAATLVYGKNATQAYSHAALDDPRVARLRSMVSMQLLPDIAPAPFDRPSTLHLTLDDGTALHATCLSAKGSIDRPLAPQQILERAEGRMRRRFISCGPDWSALHALSSAAWSKPWRC